MKSPHNVVAESGPRPTHESDYSIAVKKRETGESAWHTGSGEIRYFPRAKDLDSLQEIAERFVFSDAAYLPDEPVFGQEDRFVTMGSCFAAHLRKWLEAHGKATAFIHVPSGLNNSFAVSQYLEWCVTGVRSGGAYWYDDPDEAWESDVEQREVIELLKSTKGFVVTFGLAEVWRDRETGGVFWRGVPRDKFDADRHECVVSSVEDNAANMRKIYDLIMGLGADKHLVYTLSPVPLNATFLDRPAMVSDCVSKSILRVALEQFFSLKLPNVYYWPSFEMARWVSGHYIGCLMGDEHSPRNVNRGLVDLIISNFVRKFFIGTQNG